MEEFIQFSEQNEEKLSEALKEKEEIMQSNSSLKDSLSNLNQKLGRRENDLLTLTAKLEEMEKEIGEARRENLTLRKQ